MIINKLLIVKNIMKRKINYSGGFTLVELLIVIALIAILAVGILATINPVEQNNKANDANTQNDAGEILNAYERYYTNVQTYPWMDIDGSATVLNYDAAWFGHTAMAGAGLCNNAASGGEAPETPCGHYRNIPGSLIGTDELKASFLEKGYSSVALGDPKYSAQGLNRIWINKTPAAGGDNSIYVCYIPKAKSNRVEKNNLWRPVLTGGLLTGLERAVSADFVSGVPVATYTFQTPETSLFKCVP